LISPKESLEIKNVATKTVTKAEIKKIKIQGVGLKTQKIMHRSIVFVAMALFLLSCNENVVTSDMESISGVWNKNEPVVFTIPQQDSIKAFDVFLRFVTITIINSTTSI